MILVLRRFPFYFWIYKKSNVRNMMDWTGCLKSVECVIQALLVRRKSMFRLRGTVLSKWWKLYYRFWQLEGFEASHYRTNIEMLENCVWEKCMWIGGATLLHKTSELPEEKGIGNSFTPLSYYRGSNCGIHFCLEKNLLY